MVNQIGTSYEGFAVYIRCVIKQDRIRQNQKKSADYCAPFFQKRVFILPETRMSSAAKTAAAIQEA